MKNQTTEMIIDHSDSSINIEDAISLIVNNLEGNYLFIERNLEIRYFSTLTKKNILAELGIDINPGISVLDMVSEERKPQLKLLYEDVFQGHERHSETEIENPDGTKKYFENYFKPAYDSKENIIGAVVTSKDITARKKYIIDLKNIEERWRFAIEGSNQGVWDWNFQKNEIIYSSSYKKMYGFEDTELENKIEEWRSRIHPDDREMVDKSLQDHLTNNDSYYESIYRLKAKNNQYKWILARGMIVQHDANGNAVRMIGTHSDITDRMKAEENYRLLFYNNPLPMWTYDPQSLLFTDVNHAAIRHYGYQREQFLNMTINDIKSGNRNHGDEALKNLNSLSPLVIRHRKKNGEEIIVEIATHKIEKESGETVLVLANDITESVRVRDELNKSYERFTLISQASSDAIYDWDILNDEIYWGDGLTSLFGFSPGEVSSEKWKTLIHPEEMERIVKSLSNTLKNSKRKFWKKEYRLCKSDQTYSDTLDRGFIIRNEDGQAIRMLGSLQDITELKHNERLLSLERTIFELSSNPDIEHYYIIEKLLKGFEDIHPGTLASVLILNEDKTVRSISSHGLPFEYSNLIDGLVLGPEDSSCGAAMATKETIIVPDIQNHPLWEKYKKLAEKFELRACHSFPIIHSSGNVMGTFAIYYKKVYTPNNKEFNTLERIRNILRILMEHYYSLNEIRISNERFDLMMLATNDLMWDWNLEKNLIYRNPYGLQKVYGVSDNEKIKNINQWLERIHPDDLERVQKVIIEIIQADDQDTYDVEYRFKRDDGMISHIYDRGKIIKNEKGKPIRMIGAAQNITERKKLEQELLVNELERQKAINQATVDTQEQERSEIGKELHDNVNQVLTTTKLYLDLALTNPELKDELIEKSSKNIMGVINEIRQLSRSLMDPTIGDLGLLDSIDDLIENINLTRKLHVRLIAIKKIEELLDKNQKLTVFRIIQEALNNAIKHAKATTVIISFSHLHHFIEILIEDDGIGFIVDTVRKGAGLKNIQNRIYLINGTHTIITAPNKGCKILIKFPIR